MHHESQLIIIIYLQYVCAAWCNCWRQCFVTTHAIFAIYVYLLRYFFPQFKIQVTELQLNGCPGPIKSPSKMLLLIEEKLFGSVSYKKKKKHINPHWPVIMSPGMSHVKETSSLVLRPEGIWVCSCGIDYMLFSVLLKLIQQISNTPPTINSFADRATFHLPHSRFVSSCNIAWRH